VEAKLAKIENSEAYIEVQVDADKLEEGLQNAYRKVVKEVSLPGFRRGRVPRQILEAHFGKEILYQDAVEYVVPDAYEKALSELDIQAMAPPEFDIEEIDADKGCKFTARVAVRPEFELGDVDAIEIKIPRFEVTDEDVANNLEDMRQSYAQIVEKDEPAENGDTVEIDFEGFIDGEAFAGGKGEDYSLELGSGTFIPGFEEQLVGTRPGEEREVNVVFPENYHSPDLAGKDALFKVVVKKVQGRKLRPLDDELVQEMSRFDTVDELTQDVRATLEKMASSRRTEMIKQEVLEKALEQQEILVPAAAVDVQLERMLEQFSQRLATQGLSLEQYFQLTNSSEDDFHTEVRPEAERVVKSNLLLEKVIEEKGIAVSDEELNQQIDDAARSMGVDPEKVREGLMGIRDNIELSIKMDKAMQYLVDHAKVVEEDAAVEEDNSEVEVVAPNE
jgi:trigger factor